MRGHTTPARCEGVAPGRSGRTAYLRIRVANGALVEANGTPWKLGGGCSATYTKVNERPGRLEGQVTVTNTGSTPTTGWTWW